MPQHQIPVQPLSAETFAPFGTLLCFSDAPENELFEIVVQEPLHPWRVAMLKVVRRTALRMERHRDSMETFEPVKGVGVLFVAAGATPQDIQAFLLDAPVCLHKDIWHEVVALSREAVYKLTENADVTCDYIALQGPCCVSAAVPAGEEAL